MALMNLLPPVYDNNTTMEELQGILSKEVTDLAGDLSETIDECFIETTSSLLSRYEKIYGLEVDVSKSDAFRRERIKAKVIGIGTVTKQLIIDTAAAYSNGEVEVIEDLANYSFNIRFVGTVGEPENMDDLILTVEEIKPAHFAYTFEYIYNTYGDLGSYTYAVLAAFTYDQLRNEVMN